MAQPARVPKFGNWESTGNIPYTQYFDNARKGKANGGTLINPNDPEQNPESFHPKPPAYPSRHDVEPHSSVSKISVGTDRSLEQSPLHPKYHGKSNGGRIEVNSPSLEGHGLLAPNTPGRSRARHGSRGGGMPEKGAAVPKFGAWDESNPSSADGYTHIFEKVREEKQFGLASGPTISNDSSYRNTHKPPKGYESSSYGCGCFRWLKN